MPEGDWGNGRGMKITEKEESIVELLAMPEAADIDIDPPRLNRKMYDAADSPDVSA